MTLAAYFKDIQKELKSSSLRALAERKRKCEEEGAHSVDIRVVAGRQSDKIIEVIKEDNIDLVVMGTTTGLRGISRIKALGSVARKVSEASPCPVMLVH